MFKLKMKNINEYLLGKKNNKTVDDAEELLKSVPSNVKCNMATLENEFKKLNDLDYFPVQTTPFFNNMTYACFYLFKHPKRKNDYALVSICPRELTSKPRESIIISYTNKKENVNADDDSSIVVSVKWRSKYNGKLFNMQENVYTFLDMNDFEDYEDIKTKQWFALGKFHMMSTVKRQPIYKPLPIYNVQSFFNVK